MCAVPNPAASITRSIASGTMPWLEVALQRRAARMARQRRREHVVPRSSAGSTSSQIRHEPVKPWMSTSGGPSPPRCAGVKRASMRQAWRMD